MQQMMQLCRRSIPLHRTSQAIFGCKYQKNGRLDFRQIEFKHLSNASKESSQSVDEQNDKNQEREHTKSDKKTSEEKSNDGYEGVATFAKTFLTAAKSYKESILRNTINSNSFQEEWKEAVKEVFGAKEKRSIDEALSSTKRQPYSSPAKTKKDGEEEYTGTSALVVVKEQDTAWQKISARFREAPIIQSILDAAKKAARTEAGRNVGTKAKKAREKLDDAREEVLEFWETSQNPWIYRLSSLYDGFFGETSMGIAIREIRRAEPEFILEQWKEDIAEFVLPGVLDAFLKGRSRDLKKWFGEAAYNRINIAIRERKSEGLVMDPNVLEIDNVDVIEASAEDKQAPIILVRFRSQQINCIRNREGEIVEGAEDEVLAYYYIFAFQREYDESTERLRWRIVDVHMQRGGKYY
uniref:Mitochondrial Protein Translocase (MPT) Family puta n=1 Tax=Albugo laibachii Nc14 TaxID=890382 RepID=F0WX50_9STRA|nr:Mitochondrial Protein Translocase (MPT) Family puta [Albugo laibachii Nc14]|eukprot:CCA26040.1 Mitochondrial Protein Translocase (MPT) Family puta [Albugo laibachii Nc14]